MRLTMTTQATVRRFTIGADKYGNDTRGTSFTDTSVRCWIHDHSGDEERENREQVEHIYKVFVDGNPDVGHRDQLLLGETGSGDTPLTLEIVGDPFRRRDRRGAVHHLELIARKVEG